MNSEIEVKNCWNSFKKLFQKEKKHKLVIQGKANKSCCGNCQIVIAYNQKTNDTSDSDIILTPETVVIK